MTDDLKEKTNVVDFAAGKESQAKKKKTKKKSESSEKITEAEIFDLYAAVLDRNLPPGNALELPCDTFKVVKTDTGDRFIVSVDPDKVCRVVSPNVVATFVTQFWKNNLKADPEFFNNPKRADAIVTHWKRAAIPIDPPKAVIWANEDVYCYRKLPFIYDPAGAFPTVFFELLERLNNAELLCMFIGSLFDEKSDRQQYVWIRGDGNDGKGAIARFLEKTFGSAYESLRVPLHGQHRFWYAQLLSCRIGYFTDCDDTTFIADGTFKAATGGDSLPIDGKNQPVFTSKINTKFIFASNYKPDISDKKSDRRRLIYCDFKKSIEKVDETFEDRLWGQAQDILSYCVGIYQEYIKKNGRVPFPVDCKDLDPLSAAEDDRFSSIVEQHFILGDKNDICTAAQFGKIIQEVFHGKRRNGGERDFREWLRNKYKIVPEMSWEHKNRNIYRGLKPRWP